jgi:recombination protein RecT
MNPNQPSIEGPGLKRVRASQRLYGFKQAVTPRPAATILLLQDGADGLEVLMTRRSLQASFAPGAYVFPGGQVDAADHEAVFSQALQRRPAQGELFSAYAFAAIREAFEELGIVLATNIHGHPLDHQSVAGLDRQNTRFVQQLEQKRYTARVDQVFWLAHWITDRDLPKRFDVQFLIARMPPNQTPKADETEQFEPTWIKPTRALALYEQGQFDIIFPTIRTLQKLAGYNTVDEVIALCRDDQPMWTSCPRGGYLKGKDERFAEHELAFGELELVAPDGQMVHHLDWQHEKPVPLTKQVWRLTAPNPSMMTGPGTNTYLIGDEQGWAVIDPGPADAAHVQRIAQFVGDKLRFILCTHAHHDHSPGAFLLQKLCPAPILGKAWDNPAYGSFTPDQELQHNDIVELAQARLQVIHTPGHASNHVCFFLQQDGLLFSGDHINSGSTVVINPPDGNMLHYLQALDALARLDLAYILPAHGWVMSFPYQAIAQLKAHRLAREAKVMQSLLTTPQTMEQLLAKVYNDVKPALWPVAERSLLAHLNKRVQEALVVRQSGGYRLATN